MAVIKYSIVIPLYNEAETIPELYMRLEKVLLQLGESYEIIFVNDGSQDNTMEVIRGLTAKNLNVKALELSRNFGLQPAYSAGVDHACGEAVIIMDGDLQDPPEFIPKLVEKWKEGYDVVYAVKAKRKENIFKRLGFAAFYKVFSSISNIPMPSAAGGFSVMSRKIVDVFKIMPEKNRLVSGIRAWIGYKQTGIVFERGERFSGNPRQTFGKLLKMALDGFFSFSAVPIRIATLMGLLAAGFAVLSIFGLIVYRVFKESIPVGWTSLMIAIMFFGGIHLFFIGILGEYVFRIFDEVKSRPLYLIKEKIGFDQM